MKRLRIVGLILPLVVLMWASSCCLMMPEECKEQDSEKKTLFDQSMEQTYNSMQISAGPAVSNTKAESGPSSSPGPTPGWGAPYPSLEIMGNNYMINMWDSEVPINQEHKVNYNSSVFNANTFYTSVKWDRNSINGNVQFNYPSDFPHGPSIANANSDEFPQGINSVAEINQPQNFLTLSESLGYFPKGYKLSGGGNSETVNINYIELSVLLNYNHIIGKTGSHFHVGLGPYAAAAISGKIKDSGPGIATQIIKPKFGTGENDDFKRMDYGVRGQVGFTFLTSWDLSLYYDYGLRNILPGNDGGMKNRSVALTIGYIFK